MNASQIVFGTFGVLMALVGLVMASAATDDAFYIAGLIMFVAFVLFLFMLVKRHFDAADTARKDDAGD